LESDRVIVVPGNHDLNWDLSKKAYSFVFKDDLPDPLPEGCYIRHYSDLDGKGFVVPWSEIQPEIV
jgi:hypothetical protein